MKTQINFPRSLVVFINPARLQSFHSKTFRLSPAPPPEQQQKISERQDNVFGKNFSLFPFSLPSLVAH
jgi:hypothetical protein